MKKIYKLTLTTVIALIMLPLANAQAPENLALTASATAWTPDASGLYQWNMINDNNLGSCGTQQSFIWTSGNPTVNNAQAWMQFEWTSTKVIDSIAVHHGQTSGRFTVAMDVQSWNGSSWVYHTTLYFTDGQCINGRKFTPVVGDRIRFTNFVPGAGQNSNMNYREIQLFGFGSDLAISNLSLGTSVLCSGYEYPITINIKNNGPAPAPFATVRVMSPGAPTFTEMIQLNMMAVGRDTTLTLIKKFKNNTSGLSKKVSVLNALGDLNRSNDTSTIFVTINPSPSGSYIINSGTYNGILASGAVSNPDVTTPGRKVTYTFPAPNGYSNSNFGTDWEITDMTSMLNGNPVPGPYVTVTNPGSGDGKIEVLCPHSFEDETIVLRIKLTSLITGCDSILTRHVYIAPLARFNFSFNAPVCQGFDVQFINKSTIKAGYAVYVWDFGDGSDTIETSSDPIHAYSTSGNFNVRLKGTTNYGFVTDTVFTINIFEAPVSKFKVTNACDKVNVGFENLSTISAGTPSYTWDFGDGSPTSSAVNPNHMYPAPGVYIVKMKAEHNGCFTISERKAYVFHNPVAQIQIPSSQPCAYENVSFTNNSTIANGNIGAYWNFGDGDISTNINGSHTYQAGGNYTLKLKVVSEFGCTDSSTVNLFVKDGPLADFTFDRACSNSATQFTNTSVIPTGQLASHSWTFSDGSTSNAENPAKNWSANGPQSATLKTTLSNGCANTSTQNMVVLPQPTAAFSVSDICADKFAVLENQTTYPSGTVKYSWDFGDGSPVSSETHPNHSYPNGPTYTYNVVLTSEIIGGCSDTAVRTVTVSELPVCDFNVASDFQSGYRGFTFTPSNSSYSSYFWSFGDGGTSNEANPYYKYTYYSVFEVSLIATNDAGCQCKKSIVMNSNNTSVADVNAEMPFSLFPNPNNGFFTINWNNPVANPVTIAVTNAIGQNITNVNAVQGNNDIDLSSQPAGIYLVTITDGTNSYSVRVVVAN